MKRWLKYVKPYTPFFILGPLCMIVEVIGEVLLPRLMGMVVTNAASHTPWYSGGVAGLMILTALLMMAGGMGGAYFGAKASVYFASDLRMDIYRAVQKFSFSNIDHFSTGSLVTRLTNDVNQIQNFINVLLRMCLRAPGMLIGGLIMAILINPGLSVVFAVALPLTLIVIVAIVRIGFPRFSRMQTRVDALNSNIQENITNVRVVKSFVREDYETEKFQGSNRNLKKAGIDAMKVMVFMQPLMTLFMNLTIVAVIWFGSKRVLNAGMEVGELSSFVTYVSQILMSLVMLTMMLIMSSRALASGRRISEVLDEKSDLDDKNAAYPDMLIQEGKVEFRNVSFRYYKDSEEEVLRDINLTIEPGSTVGIIGSTGCGKSTLVSMIPRLYDVDEGEVLIDGINVRDYSLYNLREGVGMVLQKNVLFSGTIEDNLRWGDSEASDEEVRLAAEHAQADKFVSSFPAGYKTELGQGGTNVSGGQKQRLCIARTLLKKPKIIILDDSTSAVDTATEAQIRRTFREDLAGSTKIIIAQRIGSVKEADMIVVMNEGQITGVGTHEQLLETNEEYKEIYYSQMDRNDEKGGDR